MDNENEFRGGDVCLEITSWAGMSIGATHFYGKLCPNENPIYGAVTLTHSMSREEAGRLNKKHGCKPGGIGSYEEGQPYNGFDDIESVKNEAVAQCKKLFPKAQRLVLGRMAAVEHDGVICEFKAAEPEGEKDDG